MPARPKPSARYRPRDPRHSAFYRVVSDYLEDFVQSIKRERRFPAPDPHIEDALRSYLECGLLRFGAIRYRCPDCGEDLFVAFSCKLRGLCPSCDAKRAEYTAAHSLANLLPPVPFRQWVLVLPKRLRFFLNLKPGLIGEVSRIFAEELEARVRRRLEDGRGAQVHFVQRFGSALNLHVHLHVVAADGAFVEERDRWGRRMVRFVPVPPPDEAELALIRERVRRRVLRRAVRMGALPAEIAHEMLLWANSGFSLHAGTWVRGDDREGLKRLLRYCARPGVALKRMRYLPEEGKVLYEAERQEGQIRTLRLAPLEFLRKVALLVPPPRKNLTHYYGVLAPNAPLRALVTEQARAYTKTEAAKEGCRARKRLKELASASLRAWAALIARVFEVDPLLCSRCGARMEPVAVIMKIDEVTRLLDYLKLETEFPKTAPARSPPEDADARGEDCQLEARVDLYEGIDSLPTDD